MDDTAHALHRHARPSIGLYTIMEGSREDFNSRKLAVDLEVTRTTGLIPEYPLDALELYEPMQTDVLGLDAGDSRSGSNSPFTIRGLSNNQPSVVGQHTYQIHGRPDQTGRRGTTNFRPVSSAS